MKDAEDLEKAMNGFNLKNLGQDAQLRMLSNASELGLDYDKASGDADFGHFVAGERQRVLKAIEDKADDDARSLATTNEDVAALPAGITARHQHVPTGTPGAPTAFQ